MVYHQDVMKQFLEELKLGVSLAFAGTFGWVVFLGFCVWFVSYLLFL